MKLVFLTIITSLFLAACNLPQQPLSDRHVIEKPSVVATLTPPSLRPVRLPALPPAPTPRAAQEAFSVVVNDVPVKTLLFALARDNKLNVDIHPAVGGRVTLNATDQTLPQLLERISAQSDIRYEISGNLLRVQPDTPYLQNYSIDYVNLQRQSSNQVSVSASLGGSAASSSGSSDSSIKSSSENRFWETLISNVCQIVVTSNQSRNQRDEQADKLRIQDRDDRLKVALELTKAVQANQALTAATTGTATAQNAAGTAGAADLMRQVLSANAAQNQAASNASLTPSTATNITGSGSGTAGAASGGTTTPAQAPVSAATACGMTAGGSVNGATNNPLMVNKESGIVGVNTTSKGHERVRAFLDRVMAGARRQVLIEATVVEVQLSANSQSGINWSQIISTGAARGLTVNLTSSSSLSSTNAATISFARTGTAIGDISAAVSLLESFGTTKVLSSPKLSVINNQTAIIKVIDNYVYVTLSYTPAQTNANVIVSPASYTSNINTIPVGFVMTVTPQISDSGEVTLNVHPSITRVISTIVDPNPVLVNATPPITNLIPVVQSRELESILRVQSGEIAVLGGLMQESNVSAEQGIPGINRVPVVGTLAGSRSEVRAKTELVVFMRPIVIKDASVNGDYKEYKSQLPTSTFFNGTPSEAWGTQK